MEQILKEKLRMLNASYLEMIAEEMLPFRMVIKGTSTFDVKMERLMEDQEVNLPIGIIHSGGMLDFEHQVLK
jgi:hypothetical protein